AILMLAAFRVSHADSITIPKGTDVALAFDQSLSSRTAKVGDIVRLHVTEDVMAGGKTVIRGGTPVTGMITKVQKSKHFGVNAKMQINLNPVKSTNSAMIPLEPKGKGDMVSGKTGEAAGASAGGALVLGPVGLVGGYFVVGKSVNIKVGDHLVSQ